MLKDCILSTVRYFDLQDVPLTLLELHRYLIAEEAAIKAIIDENGEVLREALSDPRQATLDAVLACLDQDCREEVETYQGYYVLRGRKGLILRRLHNYSFAIEREKLIKKYSPPLKYIPFLRGAALGGSQAMGMPKETSDLDLFIVTDQNFLWLVRTLVTGYFQLLGLRRHGAYIANRFCLNHYIASPREVQEYKNLYTAAEYAKLRPLAFESVIRRYQYNNGGWIGQLFPNAEFAKLPPERQPALQNFFEQIFDNRFGLWVERTLKGLQLPRIRQTEKFIVVKDDELSFHPQSKQQPLLKEFIAR